MNGLKAIAEGLGQGGAAHEIQVDAALREGALLPSTGCWILRLHFGRKDGNLWGENGFLVRTTY